MVKPEFEKDVPREVFVSTSTPVTVSLVIGAKDVKALLLRNVNGKEIEEIDSTTSLSWTQAVS